MIKFVDDKLVSGAYVEIKKKISHVFKNNRPKDFDNPSCVIRFRNSMYDFPIQRGYLQVLMYRNLFANGMIDSSGHETMKDDVVSALSKALAPDGGTVYYFEPLSCGAALIDPEMPMESYKELRFNVRIVESGQ
jgi:hypothetical protein